MLIYLAAPQFSTAEKEYNTKLTSLLESAGFEVFSPQRDSAQAKQHDYVALPKEARRETMFELDRDQILGADIFLYVLDGRVPDEGAAVELGIAYMAKMTGSHLKHVIGLHTDRRAAFLEVSLNPMLNVPLEFVAENEEQLLEHLKGLA
jgi:nucleoside 2-deoxyribosyltransferase